MIEFIRLDRELVRVTGFTRSGTELYPSFDIVVQIPGERANDDFERLLRPARLQATIYHPDGREEAHVVALTAHAVHRAGPDQAPLYRHQLRFEPVTGEEPVTLNPIESELAEILARLTRLLSLLDDAGIISKDAVEQQALRQDPASTD